ncbi:alcohol dehydrogenase catalytic domain-containing protein [Reyranella sp.]|uniref:alcohol dehydrogenase catalytic domain-containing protein n=1 Tax=Reyranella sp. TaxID=1929291 RepID=UPI003D0CE773
MKAAVLKAFGSPLSVESVPDPVLGTGEVIVDVVAAGMLAYARDVFSGKRQYLLELPIVPGSGGIGRVRAIGPDATRLSIGDWVMIDPTIRGRDDAVAPDIILQGLTAGTPEALRLQRYYHDGAFAERVRVPTENAVPIGAIDPADAGRWFALGRLLVPYGGLLAGRLLAGETLLVNGATGAFGSAGVMAGIAMGAARIVATGRNAAVLAELEHRFGDRVRTVTMSGSEEDDRRNMQRAAGGPVDIVLDLLPPEASASWVRAAALAVRPYGRVVLMGGIREDVALPYAWMMRYGIEVRGQWMYPRDAIRRLVGMVRSGQIRLDGFTVTEFPLDQVNEAVAHAAANAGPFKMTVVRP